ncbi:MAG: metallophosphoesterase [Polyangiaceae bacterium]|nr:metallophosphoesterase [Polyangiaceae bacterium]
MVPLAEEVWGDLVTAIELAKALWIYAIECLTPDVERALYLTVATHCKKIERSSFIEPNGLKTLPTLQLAMDVAKHDLPAEQSRRPVRVVRVVDPVDLPISDLGAVAPHSDETVQGESWVLGRLNENRDNLRENLRGVLILVGGPGFVRRLPRNAPDLASVIKQSWVLGWFSEPDPGDKIGLDVALLSTVDEFTIQRRAKLTEPNIQEKEGILSPLQYILPAGPLGDEELTRLLNAAVFDYARRFCGEWTHDRYHPTEWRLDQLLNLKGTIHLTTRVHELSGPNAAPLFYPPETSPDHFVSFHLRGGPVSGLGSLKGSAGKPQWHVWAQPQVVELVSQCPALFARYYPTEARKLHLQGYRQTEYDGLPYREFERLYRAKVALFHRDVRTLGLPSETLREHHGGNHVPLRLLFVPLTFQPLYPSESPLSHGARRDENKHYFTLGNSDDNGVYASTGQDQKVDPFELGELLHLKQRVVVVGDPGTGKSTLLKFLALLFSGEADLPNYAPPQRLVPLIVSLRDFAAMRQREPTLSLLDYLEFQARGEYELPRAHRVFFEAALRMGDAVLLLDGLDEVGGSQACHNMTRLVKSLHADYPDCLIWVTSRVYGYTPDIALPNDTFFHVRVDSFTDEQVKSFVFKWYDLQESTRTAEAKRRAQSLIHAIEQAPGVKRIASNPLLLTLAAFIHHGERELPQDRGELYDKCIEMLLKTWQSAKGVGVDKELPAASTLPTVTQRDYLAHLAMAIQENDAAPQPLDPNESTRVQATNDNDARGLIHRKLAIEVMAQRHLILGRRMTPGLTLNEAREAMGEFVDYLCGKTGLLSLKGGEQIAFIHLSFQEYLAAWLFTCEPESTPSTFFIDRLGQPVWEEVLLLRLYVISHLPGKRGGELLDEVVTDILRALEKSGNEKGWLTLLRAVGDKLCFQVEHLRVILDKAVEYWLAAPTFVNVWLESFEGVLRLACVADLLGSLLLSKIRSGSPRTSVAYLNLYVFLMGVSDEVLSVLEQHPQLPGMMVDLIDFRENPRFQPLLRNQASARDWALHEFAAHRWLLAFDWLKSPPRELGVRPIEGYALATWRWIAIELEGNAQFGARLSLHEPKIASSVNRNLTVENWASAVTVPMITVLPLSLQGAEFSVGKLGSPVAPNHSMFWSFAHLPSDREALLQWQKDQLRAALAYHCDRVSDPERLEWLAQGFMRLFTGTVLLEGSQVPIEDEARFGMSVFNTGFVEGSRSVIQHTLKEFWPNLKPESRLRLVAEARAADQAINREIGPDTRHRPWHSPYFSFLTRYRGDCQPDWPNVETSLGNNDTDNELLHKPRFWELLSIPYEARTGFASTNAPRQVSWTTQSVMSVPYGMVALAQILAALEGFRVRRTALVSVRNSSDIRLNHLWRYSYLWAIAWEQQAQIIQQTHGALKGPQGVLALALAAYSALISGIELDGPDYPTWRALVDSRDKTDPEIEFAYHIHELCHFRDLPEHRTALPTLFEKANLLNEFPDLSEDKTLTQSATHSNGLTPPSDNPPAVLPTPAASGGPDGSVPLPNNTPGTPRITSGEPTVLFSWVHLSDIHFGHGSASYRWDQTFVMDALARDLQSLSTHSLLALPSPQAIFITGDIAFSGKKTQYDEARRWIEKVVGSLHLTTANVFVVPGNHDVDRSVDTDRNIKRLVRDVRDGHETLDEVLANDEDRARLAKRMGEYLTFAHTLGPPELQGLAIPNPLPGASSKPESKLYWQTRFQTPAGLPIHLMGLNTSLLAADNNDKGCLWLGEAQLAPLTTADPSALTIALSHHPLHTEWLADQLAVGPKVQTRVHLHLSGHVHDAQTEELRSGGGQGFIRISAGASHGDENESPGHGYNVAAVLGLANGQFKLRVWPRKWSAKNASFRVDVDNTLPDLPYAEHELYNLRVL